MILPVVRCEELGDGVRVRYELLHSTHSGFADGLGDAAILRPLIEHMLHVRPGDASSVDPRPELAMTSSAVLHTSAERNTWLVLRSVSACSSIISGMRLPSLASTKSPSVVHTCASSAALMLTAPGIGRT